MRQSRRFVLLSNVNKVNFVVPSFSGSYSLFGDAKKGYIELYSSGTLTFSKNAVVDVFLLGSGLCGATGSASSTSGGYYPNAYYSLSSTGGKGGNGAAGKTIKALNVNAGAYDIVIGAECASTSSANASSAFGESANSVVSNGGKGAVITATLNANDMSLISSDKTVGANGANGTSYPFAESVMSEMVDPSSIWYEQSLGAGGGGGAARASDWTYGYSGGVLGGGNGGMYESSGSQSGCTPGMPNTGSGGGGGGSAAYPSNKTYKFPGGKGGSGIVIVRWGDWSDAA